MAEAKVALVCDWLTNFGGAERVIEQFHRLFPNAPIYTSLYNAKKMPGFEGADVRTSYLQRIPGAKSKHQLFLPFYPGAFESFDLSEFDIVISSSHCCAKGIITKPSTLHICYCHSPMRYAWDGSHEYIENYPFSSFAKKFVPGFIHRLRMWDRLAADRVDFYVANSDLVKKRIQKYYQRDADVINPPVDVNKWRFSDREGQYYLAVGRLTPYKKFDLLVETFNVLGLPLKIVGDGPSREKLQKIADGNIEFLGRVSDSDLAEVYANSKAFLFPQYEDFGITPLEAMSCGRPVIAFKAGGSLDSVVEGKTGVFFEEQNVDCLIEAIHRFEDMSWSFEDIRKHAEGFDNEIFGEKLLAKVQEKWNIWQDTMV